MPNDKKLYKVTHSSPEIKTVIDYVTDPNSPAFIYAANPADFLAVAGEDGITNRQRIEETFKYPEEKKWIGLSADKLPLKVGTVLYIEYEKVNKASFVTEGIGVVSTSDVAFKAAKLAELEADKGYKSVHKPIKGQIQSGTSQDIYPDVTVWIWCRALSPRSDESNELTGQLIDLTPFIINLTTNMGKNGGNFNITLPPLICELDKENRWSIKKNTVIQYDSNNNLGQEYLAESSLFNVEDNVDEALVVNKFFFHKAISPNDLIFIRFETLELERKQRYTDSKQYYVDKANIANRIYDMIGLVDNNHQTIMPATNEVSINISGRDLSKLFIEDGTYFFALENSQGLLKFAGQTTQKNTQVNRVFGDGALSFIGLYMYTSIEYIFKFILQQLVNIKVIPDDLLSSYQYSKRIVNGVEQIYDGRNDRYNETERKFNNPNKTENSTGYIREYKKEKAPGVWQIIKLVIDSSVSERRLADSSFSTAQGSLLNFFQSAAQEPLVEFYMDTYGDQYHMIIRKPPYDQKALISLIEGKVNTEDSKQTIPPAIIDIEADDVLQENLYMDDSQVYSWYHFYPGNLLIGDAKNFSLAYLGAIYFEEYAQTFGAKAFQRSHPYLLVTPKGSSGSRELDIYEQQAISDLKYVVETNQYMPFTRKGTLTLNGDRRIKIGNVIRYKPTGEIFFVDSVQQRFTINENGIERTTTVNVSRGMVEQLIYGVRTQNEQGVSQFVSYFNLIDTRLDLTEREVSTPVQVTKKTGTRLVEKQEFSLLHPLDALTNLAANLGLTSNETIKRSDMVKGLAYLETYNAFPQNKNIFIRFINEINAINYKVTILPLAANRTYIQQAALKELDKRNAAPGHSRHEVGRAIDITVENVITGGYCTKTTDEETWRVTGIPEIANKLGLQWGGPANNGTFGNYVDRVHFELPSTLGTKMVQEDVYETVTEQRKTRILDREGVFKNFKVNKFTFNFFLKKLQFDPKYREVKNRNVYESDQAGSLPGFIGPHPYKSN